MVNIRLFASLRDLTGQSRLAWAWEEELTVERLFRQMTEKFPRLDGYRSSLLVAVNEEYSDWDRPLNDGDEVAFFPPVSGGAA